MEGIRKHESYVWNFISKARHALEDGFVMRIGAGNSSFWYDSWTKFGPLGNYVEYVNIQDSVTRINDIYNCNVWHWEKLVTAVPFHIKEEIYNMHVYINTHVQDSLLWEENIDGTYITKSGYSWLLKARDVVDHNISWTWIWKLKAPENVKFFISLAYHNATPIYKLLHNRSMTQTSICQRCFLEEESFLHCVRDYNQSKRLWDALGFYTHDFMNQMDHYKWLREGVSGTMAHLFIAGLWWAWRARNIQCISKEDMQVCKMIKEAKSLVDFLTMNTSICDREWRPESWVRWNPTWSQCMILNVDGSSLGNPGRAGFGGTIGNYHGAWVTGFAGSIGSSNNIHAELAAILHGLTITWNLGVRRVTCYTDSQTTISLITETLPKFHRYAALIHAIREKLSLAWSVNMEHTLREENQCADFLAKWGANHEDSLKIFEDPPMSLSSFLLADALGVTFLRL